MKKTIALFILTSMLLCILVACGGNSSSEAGSGANGTDSASTESGSDSASEENESPKQNNNEETANPTESSNDEIENSPLPSEEVIPEYKLGEAVETDIVRFTLRNAQLAIKLKMTSYGTYEEIMSGNTTIGDDYCTADEYDPDEDLGLAYVASKGHTYVVVEFLAENLDRGSVRLAAGSEMSEYNMAIEYNSQEYIRGVDFKASSENGYEWDRYNAINVLLLPGKSSYYRGYMDIDTDAGDLNDDFNIVISLPQSDGDTAKFKYTVKAGDRQIIENQEMSLDEAIYSFSSEEGIEYFTNHMDEYTIFSGADIDSTINGKKFDLKKKGIDNRKTNWEWKYEFESDGRVKETIYDGSVGYFNDVLWSVNGDILTIETGYTGETDEYEVRMITSQAFLLIQDGMPVILMSK